ncbi:MAG: CstA-like transporter-associated (seleno)protein [Gemmatimonadales bacterium]
MLDSRNEGMMERWQRGVFLRSLVPAFLCSLRRIAGMPDYQTYLEHLRSSHPEQPGLTEREYYSVYVSSRYGDGPTRCC